MKCVSAFGLGKYCASGLLLWSKIEKLSLATHSGMQRNGVAQDANEESCEIIRNEKAFVQNF